MSIKSVYVLTHVLMYKYMFTHINIYIHIYMNMYTCNVYTYNFFSLFLTVSNIQNVETTELFLKLPSSGEGI